MTENEILDRIEVLKSSNDNLGEIRSINFINKKQTTIIEKIVRVFIMIFILLIGISILIPILGWVWTPIIFILAMIFSMPVYLNKKYYKNKYNTYKEYDNLINFYKLKL